MWKYFFKKPISAKPSKETIKNQKYNWCLFVSGNSKMSTKFGLFFSSLGPGIKDYKNGILYVAPEDYMLKEAGERPTAYNARNAILEYFGIPYEYKSRGMYLDDLYFD